MNRIMIVESEETTRSSLYNIIRVYFGTMCETVVVKSGSMAIEQSISFRPDIAIVDTQIQGLTWIQTIREIRSRHPSTLFIITTPYSRYSYTNEAAVLDIREILTKPISRKEVVEVCTRVFRQVELQRISQSDVLFMRGKVELAIPFLEDSFINGLIRKEKGNANAGYLKLLGVPQESGSVVTLEFREKGKRAASVSSITASEKIEGYYDDLRKIVLYYLPCLMSFVMGNRVILYVPADIQTTLYGHKEELTAKVRKLVQRLEKEFDLQFRAGIGDTYETEQSIWSYRESLQCLSQKSKSVVHIKDFRTEGIKEGFPREQFNNCLQTGLKSDHDSAAAAFEELWVRMDEAEYETDEIEKVMLELMCVTEHKAAETGLIRWERLRDSESMACFRSQGNRTQMRKWYLEQWLSLCDDISAMRTRGSDSVSGKAIKYIREHFSEEISLEEVSQAVNISPFYFSRLFKHETGKNFIEFLNDTRMQKAKEYLVDPMYSIKEICHKCGYSDPNYFSRIFRKYEGISPSEWRSKTGTNEV